MGSFDSLTIEQRRDALDLANAVRVERAAFRRKMSSLPPEQGVMMFLGEANSPTRATARWRVESALCAIRGIGPTKAKTLMGKANVGPTRRLGGLTPSQIERLTNLLGADVLA